MHKAFNSLLVFFILIFLASCVSIRYNYLGKTDITIPDSTFDKITSVDKRTFLQHRADSILTMISEQKRHKRHILAKQINNLYSDLGEQIETDRYYNYILQNKSDRQDSLTYRQFLAAVELLSSASEYERSYQKLKIVRRTINRGDKGNLIPRNILQKSSNFLYSPVVRKRIESDLFRCYNYKSDSALRNLPKTNTLIALGNRIYHRNDRINSFFYIIVYGGSYVVGNTIGLFHLGINREQNIKLLAPQLKPFDIVLMKSPEHLTDQFIPGYFGHVGIWLGNELASKMKNKSNPKDDTKGRTIVEVLRSGVKISTLRDFCDGQVFLIIRPVGLTEQQKEIIIANTKKQLNKDYDFNFDIESPESITCTELVYLAFDYIDWKIRYTWSRYTLSPDDLLKTALSSHQLEIPLLLRNGIVTANPDSMILNNLYKTP